MGAVLRSGKEGCVAGRGIVVRGGGEVFDDWRKEAGLEEAALKVECVCGCAWRRGGRTWLPRNRRGGQGRDGSMA